MSTPTNAEIMKRMNDRAKAEGRYLGMAFWEIPCEEGSILDVPTTPEAEARLAALRAERIERRKKEHGGDDANVINQVVRLASLDAERVYRDLSRFVIRIARESDGWHVDFDLQDTKARGGGPHYIIDSDSGIIVTKRYEQ